MNKHLYIVISSLALFILSCTQASNGGEFKSYDMINAAAPQDKLVTGGQPSKDDLARLAKRGTKVIINLRTKGEFKGFNEKEVVESLGMKYVSIEINGSSGITVENARKLDIALNNLQKPALVHCASSNRVGGLLAYRAFKFQNKSAKESLEFGEKAGMRSTEKRVQKLLSN